MEPINNNLFEVKPNPKTKRKIEAPHTTAYHNPALDILANEDPICNNKMEIIPHKKRKRTKSCEIAAFENNALDIGVSKAAVNEFFAKELENVKKNLRSYNTNVTIPPNITEKTNDATETDIMFDEDKVEPIYENLKPIESGIQYDTIRKADDDDIEFHDLSQMEMADVTTNMSEFNETIPNETQTCSISNIEPIHCDNNSGTTIINHIHTTVVNNIFINNQTNLSLSFIDRLALDSPNQTNQSLYLDDDLNESNIMEIKAITLVPKTENTESKKNTNPFLTDSPENIDVTASNPFLDINPEGVDVDYNVYQTDGTQVNTGAANIQPKRLFCGDTNSTVSTLDESLNGSHTYENVDSLRAESPIYENVCETLDYNKQSKILGYDVTKFSAIDIMNLNKNSQVNDSNESSDSKKDFKKLFRASKRVFKTLKKTFKGDKLDNNVTLNPYEVPRKVPKKKVDSKENGIENPALNIDNSDEIEIEDVDDEEHQYETIKTLRNTKLNMNVTPLQEHNDNESFQNKTQTPGKKVRFDSTLNKEKVITGNSFDYGLQSPGFDVKIDKYQDELENCINERKFIQQNM